MLGALGVSEDVIREDYLLTNETCEREAEMLYRNVLSTGKTEAEATAAREVFLAKKEYLEAALGAIKENYGAMDAFFPGRAAPCGWAHQTLPGDGSALKNFANGRTCF